MSKVCKTGKRRFKREQDAANALVLIQKKQQYRSKVRATYRCSICNGYHLTSNPKHGTKGNIDRALSMKDLREFAMQVRSAQLIEPMPARKALNIHHVSRKK